MAISVPPYMPIAQQQRPNIDIAGSIGGLGDALTEGLEFGRKRKIDRATREALAGGLSTGPGGAPDYMTAAGRILQGGGDVETALTLARLAEVQERTRWERNQPDWQMVGTDLYNLNALSPGGGGGAGTVPSAGGGQAPAAPLGGLGEQPQYPPDVPQPQTAQAPTGPQPVIRGTPKRRTGVTGNKLVDLDTGEIIQEYPAQPKALGATDRKAIRTAKEQNVQLKSTVASLDRALELNDKIFTGAGAEARQALGTQLPDWMVPNQIAGPQQAQQTEEWRSLMKPEAIAAMANSLSGATTDFELRQFVELMADPKTTAQTRRALIDRMKKLAVEKQALNEDLVREYEEGADVIAEPAAEVSPDNPTSPEAEGEIVESGGVRYMLMPDGSVVQLD